MFSVTMLLADAVQVADNKLNVLGAGWDFTGPAPTPGGVGVIIRVPWDETNRKHHAVVEILDEDGRPFAPDGNQAIRIEAEFEVGRPPGIAPGTALTVPLGFNYGPMPWVPGKRYAWVLSIDGVTHEDWRLPFQVRPPHVSLAS